MPGKRRQCVRCQKFRDPRFFRGERGKICTTCRKKKTSHATHGRRITNQYGITGEEYQTILAHQGGVCAICQGTRKNRLDVDHDHKHERETGDVRSSIRGLLCARCNRRLLTAAMNNPEILERAAEYLRNPPAQQVLGVADA